MRGKRKHSDKNEIFEDNSDRFEIYVVDDRYFMC